MNKKDFIIPNPDFEEFDGIFVGSKDGTTLPPNNIDFSKIIVYNNVVNKNKTLKTLGKRK